MSPFHDIRDVDGDQSGPRKQSFAAHEGELNEGLVSVDGPDALKGGYVSGSGRRYIDPVATCGPKRQCVPCIGHL